MSDKVDRFPIYRNSYNLTKFLPKSKQEKMALAILEYVFDDKEPQFNDNDSNTLWENIFLILKKTKAQVLNGRKGGKKANSEANGQANSEANGQANSEANGQANSDPNNIYYFIFIISNFIKENNYSKNIELSLKKWIKYKLEKKSLPSKTSFEELLKVIKINIQKHGEEKVCDLINNCIASNYQAIIFEKINSSGNNRNDSTQPPAWYGKEIKIEEMSEEEIKLLDEKMRRVGINV